MGRQGVHGRAGGADQAPTLVVLDGINAACSLHGWNPNETGGVGAYRLTFEKPATKRDAAVLSLGHPPKARDRQDERHGYGSTAWLDEVDGVGFRMEAAKVPIRRGHRGGSRLYAVKDRDDQVKQHGHQVVNRDGWSYLGQFVLDDTGLMVVDERGGHRLTQAQLLAPSGTTAPRLWTPSASWPMPWSGTWTSTAADSRPEKRSRLAYGRPRSHTTITTYPPHCSGSRTRAAWSTPRPAEASRAPGGWSQPGAPRLMTMKSKQLPRWEPGCYIAHPGHPGPRYLGAHEVHPGSPRSPRYDQEVSRHG
jgi:hypothetical protein